MTIKEYIRFAALVADLWAVSYLIYLTAGTWAVFPVLLTGIAIAVIIVIDFTEEKTK